MSLDQPWKSGASAPRQKAKVIWALAPGILFPSDRSADLGLT